MTKVQNLHKVLFLLTLCLALFASCTPKNDNAADIGADQAPGTVESITSTPGNPYAGTAQVAPVEVFPYVHGSLGLKYAGQDILVDPYDGAERYTTDFNDPDILLITHTHGDHMDKETLKGITFSSTRLIGPKAVTDAIGNMGFAEVITLANGEADTLQDIVIKAVPAYNYPQTAQSGHKKGDFNGYVLTLGKENYYISGDTGPAPELNRDSLGIIDVAFVSMNQPYTMTVEDAARMVTGIRPGLVYPYHYRNKDGSFSDVEKFKQLVDDESVGIDVRLNDWYAAKPGAGK